MLNKIEIMPDKIELACESPTHPDRNIILNQWYRFSSIENKKAWLNRVLGYLKKIHIEFSFVTLWELYQYKELLKITPKGINYRTSESFVTLYDKYEFSIKTYGDDSDNNDENHNQKEVNMELINVKFEKEYNIAREEFLAKLDVEFEKTIIVKTIKAVYPDFENYQLLYNTDRQLFTEKETEALNEIRTSYSSQKEFLKDRFREIRVLYGITETYEQRIDLLKKYNII